MKKRMKIENFGWIAGFLVSYFLFTSVLYFMINRGRFFDAIDYALIMLFTMVIVLSSRILKKALD
jgi:hypothetical protein